jgi:cathepsin L
MKNLLLLAVFLATLAFADFPRHHQLEGYTFKDFVVHANRQYPAGSAEWKKREKLFNDRLADIKKHNADPTKSWKRGINQFSDWTDKEFRDYNRARPDWEDINKRVKVQGWYEPKMDKTVNLPRFVDYRLRVNPPILTGVKNQGSCGSCWAHAATESVESFFALRYGQLPVLSTQQVTSCTPFNGGCGGGSYHYAWDSISGYGGLNEEWTYPYVDFFAPQMSWNNTQACQNITAKFPYIEGVGLFTWWPKANVTSSNYVKRNDAHAMMEALATIGPLAISVAASDQWSDYESGVLTNNYTLAGNWSWQEINHDTQIVGYGYDFDLNMNYWIVRNSWGTNYGEQGFIRLDRPEVEPCGDLTGSTICGTSGVLSNPGYPTVAQLEKDKLNGYYF